MSYFAYYFGAQYANATASNLSQFRVQFNPAGLMTFLAINMMVPVTIEKFWNKKIFKEQYYDYLDEEMQGMEGYTLQYY